MNATRQENEGYRRFREAILSGRLEAGMVITQNELCDLLGLSLSPLRETLVLLEEFGLVEIKPRTGIRVVYPEVTFIRDNYQFRIMIETFAIRTIGESISKNWLIEMRGEHETCRALLQENSGPDEGLERFVQLDMRFHREIVAVIGNRAISETHERIQANIRMAQRVHRRAGFRAYLVETVDEHMRVIGALEAGDIPGAIAALEAHFRASTHRTFLA
jgi:DNA-binding GntR family transcriptional regulator